MSTAVPFRKDAGRQAPLTFVAVVDVQDLLKGAPVVTSANSKSGISVPGDINSSGISAGTGTSLSAKKFNIAELPAGAVVIGGSLIGSVVFNSTTSDTISIVVGTVAADGTMASPDATLVSAADVRTAVGVTAFTLSAAQVLNNTSPKTVQAVWTSGGGTPTTGKVTVVGQYVIPGRAQENQGW